MWDRIHFQSNRRGKTRIWEKWTKKYKRRQEPDKICILHPLHKIRLHRPLPQSQDHKNSDIKNFNWKVWIYSFIHWFH